MLNITQYKFQSTHPRRVWLPLSLKLRRHGGFNPHTHAGCDCRSFLSKPDFLGFNPHTHAGCDDGDKQIQEQAGVSIHTPTQGVTVRCKTRLTNSVFQSTHPRRVWPCVHSSVLAEPWFQSTHPRRVWQIVNRFVAFIISFNPHTHAGCDRCHGWPASTIYRFNPHTHAGCDGYTGGLSSYRSCFNPHTHAGCDLTAFHNRFYS